MIANLLKTIARDLIILFIWFLFRIACLKEYLLPHPKNKLIAGDRYHEVSLEARTLYWICGLIRGLDKLDNSIVENPSDEERFESLKEYLQQRQLNNSQLEKLGTLLQWLFIPFDIPVETVRLKSCSKPSYFVEFNSEISKSLCFVYIHGGGYTMANFALGFHTNAFLAKDLNANLLVLSYDFLPNSTLENIIENTAMEAYYYLVNDKKMNPKNIILIGESAGGNMAINMGRIIGKEGCKCIIAHSPWLDLTHSLAEEMAKYDDCLITEDFTILCKDVISRDPKVKYYSPMFWKEELEFLPPLFVSCSETEKFILEMRKFEQNLKETTQLQYQVMTEHIGVPHAYSGMFGFTREGKEVEARIINFLQQA